MEKFKLLDTDRTMKNIRYYEDQYFGFHSTVYMDNYKNTIKGEIINRDLTRVHSGITNNGLNKTIRHIEM